MNPLVLLPLLAAATVAAPGGIALTGQPLFASPAIAQYQVNVPVTKTIHYDVKPVVTGYSSTILKPSIVQQAVAAPVVSVAAPQPVVLKSEPAVVSAPVQQLVQQDTVVVEARNAAPAVVAPAPVQQVAVAQPVLQVAPAPVQPVVQLRQAQAGDFGPLVTQEKVLAPVRQHTQITPQVTQVQPEVTVRKVVQEVAVPQPIYQTPVVHQTVVAQPAFQQVVAQPQFLSAGLVGHNFVGQVGINGLNVVA